MIEPIIVDEKKKEIRWNDKYPGETITGSEAARSIIRQCRALESKE